MLNISKIARASEWWEYKLPPMLSMVYATCLVEGKNLFQMTPRLGVLLCGIIIGAAYVSVINDITDMKQDAACGKPNRLSIVPHYLRIGIVLLLLFAGFLFTYFFLDDLLSILLYIACWISFSLYSIPPFRLKKRGFSGVLADACGAHLLPTIFLLSATCRYFDLEINWFWFCIVGLWSLMYGLRGILWHQFYDREHDLEVGINTYASKKDPSQFGVQSLLIISIELLSLSIILAYIFKPLPALALLCYLFMLAGYLKIFKRSLITIVSPTDKQWHFAMNNYYQFLLPLALLCSLAMLYPQIWIFFAAHFIFFPVIARNTITDALSFFKAAIKKMAL